ncbi:LytTR family DNA-binding domain-containing protein [Fulvivirgaceae bacterium BMA10]|uniref:LytTR family DNA-binding domain-containing protein n=1 Tax=Splendidivirga corallicola TaxID=3051826 RepID=A0ABT8KWZ5_9BACT|nr:LytTR family DNA-binding domain-containing protein [Fulvivirgaceae bacterium BMA10]
MLRAIIIEDEASSRETLRNYLSQYCADVSLLAEAGNIQDGKTAIEIHNPDIVFLDVEMPFGNGFDLLESLDEINFEIIFVTAFSHYAIRAIQFSASNYILKPIDIDELVAAVDKVKNGSQDNHSATKILLENLRNTQLQATKIVLPVLEGLEIIQAQDIIHCEANDNFTRFHLHNGKPLMICRTLKYYEKMLEPLGFMRTHKSHLINLEKIRKYVKGKGGYVIMSNDAELAVSPNKKAMLLEKLAV